MRQSQLSEAYYASDPQAKDKNATLYYLAVSHEARGNTAKACGYYKQVIGDPKFKQMAEYKIKSI